MSQPTTDWPRVTGIGWIDKPLDELRAIHPASMQRRLLFTGLLAVGLLMMGYGSMVFREMIGPIPFRIFPDVRPVFLVSTALFLGLQAAGGGARRRAGALWGVFAFVLLFHLEEATVFWIGPFPGSITGTRVGLLGTAGSIVSLTSVLLMHVEVESARLARDAKRRGAPEDGAEALGHGLRRMGARRALAVAVTVAALSIFIRGIEVVVGNDAPGGGWVLLVGGGILLSLAILIARWVPKASPHRQDGVVSVDADDGEPIDAAA